MRYGIQLRISDEMNVELLITMCVLGTNELAPGHPCLPSNGLACAAVTSLFNQGFVKLEGETEYCTVGVKTSSGALSIITVRPPTFACRVV